MFCLYKAYEIKKLHFEVRVYPWVSRIIRFQPKLKSLKDMFCNWVPFICMAGQAPLSMTSLLMNGSRSVCSRYKEFIIRKKNIVKFRGQILHTWKNIPRNWNRIKIRLVPKAPKCTPFENSVKMCLQRFWCTLRNPCEER